MRSVTYYNLSKDPNTAAKSVAWLVNDGAVDANADFSTTYANTNDALSSLARTVSWVINDGDVDVVTNMADNLNQNNSVDSVGWVERSETQQIW